MLSTIIYHSTSKNFNTKNYVGSGGFEPPKSKTTDLQSVPFGRSGNCPLSRRRESNPRPADYKSAALPTELLRHKIKNYPVFRDGKGNGKLKSTKFLKRKIYSSCQQQ